MSYDGFISYSHAADDLLAPRLQSGLQRFAKPWWKRRALRVFRDQSSLSANPHLWESITEALDASGWFVLLLSPDAARSEWVNQEVSYWVEHRDPARILPVVTAGEFGWADGDVTGDAVPEVLRGVFRSEPRWVDLRFAQGEEQLDLQDPRFADAIADVASAMRGVPKDELAGEEVRQHRRTVRTAWSAGVLLAALAVTAASAGLVASRNADEARANAAEAERQATIAASNAEAEAAARQEADANAAEATAERNNALDAAALARSLALAATSVNVLDDDPELASLLSVLSARTAPGPIPAETLAALRASDAANLVRYRVAVEPSPQVDPLAVHVAPDGSSFFTQNTESVTRYDLETGQVMWQASLDGLLVLPVASAVSPIGDLVVVAGLTAEGTGRVVVMSAADGSIQHQLEEVCPYPGWLVGDQPFFPDGSVLVYGTGEEDCLDRAWVSFVDTNTWEEIDRVQIDGALAASVAGDGRTIAFIGSTTAEVVTYPGLEPVDVIGPHRNPNTVSLSGVGGRIAYDAGDRVRIEDVATGELIGNAEGAGNVLLGAGTVFSPDGERLLVLTRDGMVLVDARNGRLLRRIGGVAPAWDAAFTPDGNTLISVDQGGVSVWGLGAGEPLDTSAGPVSFFDSDAVVEGPRPAVLGTLGRLQPGVPEGLLVFDQAGETITDVVTAAAAAQLPDGRFAIAATAPAGTVPADAPVFPSLAGAADRRITGLEIWDPTDGSRVTLLECDALMSETERYAPVPTGECVEGAPVFAANRRGQVGLAVSPDGTKIAASGGRESKAPLPSVFDCGDPGLGTRQTWIWDAGTGAVLATIPHTECWELLAMGNDYLMMARLDEQGGVVLDFEGNVIARPEFIPNPTLELTADGRHVITHGLQFGTMVVYSTDDWSEVARWAADDSLVRGLALSPDQTRLITTSEASVRVWDVGDVLAGISDRPTLLDEIPVVASDAIWLDDSTLGLALREGRWLTVSVDAARVAEHVLARMTRSFTPEECADYRIDPCPTLQELSDA